MSVGSIQFNSILYSRHSCNRFTLQSRYREMYIQLLIPMVVSNTIILSGSYLGVGCGIAPWRLSTAELPLNPPRLRGRVREEGSISPVLLMTLQALLAI